MQGKAEEGEPANAGQRRNRLRLRRHAPAERFAAGHQRQIGAAAPGLRHRRPNRRMRERRRIGPLAAFFHVGKLITQRRDAALAQSRGNRFHRSMRHARTRPVRQHITRTRCWRAHQKRGDRTRVRDIDVELSHVVHINPTGVLSMIPGRSAIKAQGSAKAPREALRTDSRKTWRKARSTVARALYWKQPAESCKRFTRTRTTPPARTPKKVRSKPFVRLVFISPSTRWAYACPAWVDTPGVFLQIPGIDPCRSQRARPSRLADRDRGDCGALIARWKNELAAGVKPHAGGLQDGRRISGHISRRFRRTNQCDIRSGVDLWTDQ